MTCETALERMLDAAPAALRGEDDSELARHLAECRRCGALAAAVLEELDAVDRALSGFAAADARAAADAALAAIRGEAEAALPSLPGPGGAGAGPAGTSRRSWTRRAWIPLAAAAALAAVLVLAREERPPTTRIAPGPEIEPRVSVTPPPGRGAAIMETANPNITIVWLYEREES